MHPLQVGDVKCHCLSSDDLGPLDVSLVQLHLLAAELGTLQQLKSYRRVATCPLNAPVQ